MATEKVLQVKNLVVSFKTDRGIVHAVRGVSFDLYQGETLCIVGESGSGKSVTNKAIMGISANNAIVSSGQILYQGEDLVRVSEEEFHRIRGHKIGMIFQDPLSALNPTMRIGNQITEATLINKNILKRLYEEKIANELTTLRNAESNNKFEVTRKNNQIEFIDSKIKELNKNYKLAQKEKTKIDKLKGLEENEKNKAKLEVVNEKYEKYLANSKKLHGELVDFEGSFKREMLAEVSSIDEQIAREEKLLPEQKSELKQKIHKNKIESLKARKQLFTKISNKKYDEDLFKALGEIKLDCKEIIVFLNKILKAENPDLKKDLALRKKEAKVEVEEYHKEIKAKKDEDIKTEVEKLAKIDAKILELRQKLAASELEKIDKVLKENSIIAKKIEKQKAKFKEINVSKTQKGDELVIKATDNAEYDALLKEKETVQQTINQIEEDYISKTKITKAKAKKMALEVMKEVGIPLPERRFKQYPFEFSGGMRQRIVIAIALTADPDILICDEPTTALDVTIQAQILDLINKLKVERHLSCIFITHDLGVVAHMADRVAVMYAGKIVEYGTVNEIFFEPKHPYTWALLSSIPDINSKRKLETIPGTPPDMLYPPKGDAFALRSKYAMKIDEKYEPPFFKVSDTHYAATWLLYPGAPKVEMPEIVKERIANSIKDLKKEEKEAK
jgi:oligopeptide/dipeptide ABC transporter ATP-binding protein